ncbi:MULTISPECIES: hypothetical protein [unclassified Kitasatospora]|uniref:hypothetical protein n=1 Tax=unclassified Kitasatospora TaxID=2633591 RepID=UPI0012F8BAFA|nr:MULTISPECIES: hypothetical protein [unclassified Kitasatospora]
MSDSPYAVTTDSGAVYSYVHLYWNSSTGQNCAVNVKTGSLSGTPTLTQVALIACRQDSPEGGSASQCTAIEYPMDPGRSDIYYNSYAGPVTVHGDGHCVMATGITYDTHGTMADYRSPMFHC